MSGADVLVAIFREMAGANVLGGAWRRDVPWLCCGLDVEGVEKLGDKCYFRVLRLYAAPD